MGCYKYIVPASYNRVGDAPVPSPLQRGGCRTWLSLLMFIWTHTSQRILLRQLLKIIIESNYISSQILARINSDSTLHMRMRPVIPSNRPVFVHQLSLRLPTNQFISLLCADWKGAELQSREYHLNPSLWGSTVWVFFGHPHPLFKTKQNKVPSILAFLCRHKLYFSFAPPNRSTET